MKTKKYLCLHDIPIFSGMDKISFLSICHTARKQHIKKGEFLFRQGNPGCAVYYIKEGSFKLVRITENGEEVIVQIVGSCITMTQQEIASAVGASRVMVSQVLQELIKNDYICRNKKHYILKRKCIY